MSVHDRHRDSFDSRLERLLLFATYYHWRTLFFSLPFRSRALLRAQYFFLFETVYASNWDTCQLELVTAAREKGCSGGEKKK